MAKVYYLTDRFDAALEHLRQAVEVDPDYASERDEWLEARDMFTQAYAYNPDNLDALYNIGICYYALGDHYRALEYWEELYHKSPTHWQAIIRMIQSLQAIGDTARREQLRRELYDLRATSADRYFTEIKFYIREYFTVPDLGVKGYVLEYFDFEGERFKKYRFMVYDPSSGDLLFEISVGSHEFTKSIYTKETA